MKKDTSEEDKALWQHVAASVKPIRNRKAAVKKDTLKKRETKKSKETAAVEMPVSQKPPSPTKTRIQTKESAPVFNTGFDKSTETKFKKGQLETEGRLDLHGMTQDEAHRALTRFIQAADRAGKRNLLVITGKGKVSTGGVLRRMLPLWLEGNPNILAISAATPKDGGSGAFYIRLRKKK